MVNPAVPIISYKSLFDILQGTTERALGLEEPLDVAIRQQSKNGNEHQRSQTVVGAAGKTEHSVRGILQEPEQIQQSWSQQVPCQIPGTGPNPRVLEVTRMLTFSLPV